MQILSEWTLVEDILDDAQSVSSISRDGEFGITSSFDSMDREESYFSEVHLVKPIVLHLFTEVCRLRKRNSFLRQRLHAYLSRKKPTEKDTGRSSLEYWEYIMECLLSLFSFMNLTEDGYTKFEWKLVEAILNKKSRFGTVNKTAIDPVLSRIPSVQLRAWRLVGSMYKPDLSYQRTMWV